MKMTMKIPCENYMITLITLKYLPKLYQQVQSSILAV